MGLVKLDSVHRRFTEAHVPPEGVERVFAAKPDDLESGEGAPHAVRPFWACSFEKGTVLASTGPASVACSYITVVAWSARLPVRRTSVFVVALDSFVVFPSHMAGDV